MPSLITPRFIEFARREFRLDWDGIHGAPHWSRVRHNGLLLAEHTGANTRVVEYFAFIHDLGRRTTTTTRSTDCAPPLAERIAGDLIDISETELALLTEACCGHSDGHIIADVTVMTCWDADRLDLGRVGIRPDPRRLCSEVAKRPRLLVDAYKRSVI
ncbi:MAG: hypothetical protein R3E50_12230 [Halioglobus sp.]